MVAGTAIIIDNELRELIPALSEDELAQLEANVLADGCRDSLVVWDADTEQILLDGHNRWTICQKYKIPFGITVHPTVETRDDAKLFIIDNQCGRRNLNAYQRTRLALQKKQIIAARAKPGTRTDLSQNSAKGSLDTRDEIDKSAHVSHDTVSKVERIIEHADDETKQQLERGEKSIHQAHQEIVRAGREAQREAKREQNRDIIAKAPTLDEALQQARFTTIVADPPWDWGDEGDVNQMGRARPDYGTMSFDKLLELPVQEKVDDDAHLYLWITNRSLPKGFALLEAWGFRYITCLTWCKPSFGMGNYFRGSTEQILFAVKGSQPLKRKDAGTWFQWSRGEDGHSSKPLEFYDLVESCSPGPFLEMFSRTDRKDWFAWGESS